MSARRQSRGFTLIELIISMAIVILAVALAGAGFVAQNQALQSSDLHRIGNASARDAMLTLETTLRTVGWGVDPRFAIDVYDGAAPLLAATSVTADQTNAPDTLTVVARNPLYQWTDANTPGCAVGTIGGCYTGNAWPIISMDTGTRTFVIAMRAGQRIERGRLFQVQCLGGTNPVILRYEGPLLAPTANGNQNITYHGTAAFPYNNSSELTNVAYQGCHGQPGAAMFLLDRTRFYVDSSSGPEPWLMLDPTVDVNDDSAYTNADHTPVARYIEDFQVAYMLTTLNPSPPDAPLGSGDYVLGNRPGTAETPAKHTGNTDGPLYTTALDDSSRFNTKVANVKGIRVSIIARSARQEPNRPQWPGDAIPYGENRDTPALTPTGTGKRWFRWPMVSEISTRNMDSQRPFTF
jgi:type II secretory pathway pseudopilin PulG